MLWDHCLSFPDLLVRVKRHVSFRLDYRDEHWMEKNLHIQGVLSELLQHEIDHLDGVLAVARALATMSQRASYGREAFREWQASMAGRSKSSSATHTDPHRDSRSANCCFLLSGEVRRSSLWLVFESSCVHRDVDSDCKAKG